MRYPSPGLFDSLSPVVSLWIRFPPNIRPVTFAGFLALGFLGSRRDGGRQRQRLRVPQLSRSGVLALTGHLFVLYLSGLI